MWEKVPAEPEWEYHAKNWQMLGREGYYPNVNNSKLGVINAVRKKLEDCGYWENFDDTKLDNDNDEPVFLKLLRFCRAEKWNVEEIVTLVKTSQGMQVATMASSALLTARACACAAPCACVCAAPCAFADGANRPRSAAPNDTRC